MRECYCNGTAGCVFHGIVYDIGYNLLQFVAVGGDAIVSAVHFGRECEGELARVYVRFDFGDGVLYELWNVISCNKKELTRLLVIFYDPLLLQRFEQLYGSFLHEFDVFLVIAQIRYCFEINTTQA